MAISDLFAGMQTPPPEVREAFKDTEFVCHCGGDVWPETMYTGRCFSCKGEVYLADLDYHSTGEE